MSSNNKDETGAIAMVLGMAGAAIVMVGVFFFMLIAFISFLMTATAIIALWRPVQIGSFTVTTEMARTFLRRSAIGALAFPAFFLLLGAAFGVFVRPEYLLYMTGAGYVLLPLALELLIDDERPLAASSPRPQIIAVEPELLPPPHAPRPYRYASWDDEEELR